MKKSFRIFPVVLLVFVLLFGMVLYYFRNAAMLLGAALFHTTPPYSFVTDVRKDLMGQKRFQDMLKQNEEIAMARFSRSGSTSYTKRYLYKLRISMFDLPFLTDVWATRVRTDMVQGRPKTAFLIRLGIEKDANALKFFGEQRDSATQKTIIGFLINTYNRLFDWGLLKPYRINITESDQSSSMGSHMLSNEKWDELVSRMHHGQK